MKKRAFTFLLSALLCFSLLSSPAYAGNVARDMALIFRGTAKTIGAAFEIPRAMLIDSTRIMFPFGIVTGAIGGSMRMLGGTLSGAFDIARGAAPYAKYMIFL